MLILLFLPSPFLRPVLSFPPFPRLLLLRDRRALAATLERDAAAARPPTNPADVFLPQLHHTAHRRLHAARRGALGTVATTLDFHAAAAFTTEAFRRGGGSGAQGFVAAHLHDAATGAFLADHGVLGRGRAAHGFVA